MFYQIFLSPQVKRCAIITYKRGIHRQIENSANSRKKVLKKSCIFAAGGGQVAHTRKKKKKKSPEK